MAVEKSLRKTVDCSLTHFGFSFVTEEVDSMHAPIYVKLKVCALKSWVCRPVYPYGFAVIPTDSDLEFRCYAGWVKNYGHCPIFPFPHFKLE